MILLVVVVVLVVWVATARDVVRRVELGAGRRVAWVIATLLLPIVAVPVYWLIRPLPRRSAPATAPAGTQTLADLIPGWAPDQPDACEQADAWARSASRVRPAPSFYTWLRESGLAEKYPVCVTRLVRTLLGGERRPSFFACPELGALTGVLERYIDDQDDLIAVKKHLRLLCPAVPTRDQGPGAAVEARRPRMA